jgi:hypothetical protein
VDQNAYVAQQMHRQRTAELERHHALRSRNAERDALAGAAVAAVAAPAAAEEADTRRWQRLLVRWHIASRFAH